MRVLDLFAGIGGFSLGLQRAGMVPVAFCEIEPFCRAVLAKHWPGALIYHDARTLRGAQVTADLGAINLICAGFPCQPHSLAGRREGGQDERDLWPDTIRIVRELQPKWFVGENVPGILTTIYDRVLSDLESAGYEVEPLLMEACAFGADHRRERLFLVAHAKGERMEGVRAGRLKVAQSLDGPFLPVRNRYGQWEVEPDICRTTNGLSGRVDRLRSLGNAVTPPLAEAIGRAILEADGR